MSLSGIAHELWRESLLRGSELVAITTDTGTCRGDTDRENIEEFCLVHMNERISDSDTATSLVADPDVLPPISLCASPYHENRK